MRLAEIDLSNPDLFAAGPPHEAFKLLRHEAPLFWNGHGGSDGFWELPLQVIVEMMGVPIEDRHKVFEWSNTMIGFDDPEYGAGSNEAGKVAAAEIYMYANQLAAEHRRCPRDDMVSVLLDAEVEGEKL